MVQEFDSEDQWKPATKSDFRKKRNSKGRIVSDKEQEFQDRLRKEDADGNEELRTDRG